MSYSGNYSYRSDYNFGDFGSLSATAPSNTAATASSAASVGTAAAGMGPAGIALAAGTMAFQVYSGLKQAETIRQQAELTAKLNELNAKYIEYDAWQAEAFGQTEQARYQSEIDRVAGDQKVALAAADVDINYGTAAELQAETRLTGVLNKIEIQNQAYSRSLGYRREANNVRFRSKMQSEQAEAQAQASITAGIAGAAQTGISAYARK